MVLAATGLHAEGLPSEIHILVPVTTASSLDARARVIADAIGQRLKQRVIVENRASAGGTIGALAVAKSKPDGVHAAMHQQQLRDQAACVRQRRLRSDQGLRACRTSLWFRGGAGGPSSFQVGSLKELVAFTRRQPQPLSYASSGTGRLPHLATELFKQVAGIDLLHGPLPRRRSGTTRRALGTRAVDDERLCCGDPA